MLKNTNSAIFERNNKDDSFTKLSYVKEIYVYMDTKEVLTKCRYLVQDKTSGSIENRTALVENVETKDDGLQIYLLREI